MLVHYFDTELMFQRPWNLQPDHRADISQEFQAWYDSQAGPDEASIDTIADNVVSLAAEPPAWVSLAEIKRLTG